MLIYSPRGKNKLSKRSRDGLCYPVKQGNPTTISAAADRIREYFDDFSDYFGKDVFLVPVPGMHLFTKMETQYGRLR